jgi:hypothetical protein
MTCIPGGENAHNKIDSLTHRFDCSQGGNASGICTTDFKFGELESETHDCRVNVSLYWSTNLLRQSEVGEYAKSMGLGHTVIT